MAANLLRAGFPLAVYNRSKAPRTALALIGARAFSGPDGLFADCDTVILMLANDLATDQVLGRGSPRFVDRVAGKLIVNMGTHAPAWSKSLERDVIAAGGRFVEAPVSGSRVPAESGELIAMVAGEAGAVETTRPLLDPLCREVVLTGAVPSAMACKMAVNLYLIASVAALAEATALAKALDLSPAIFERVIGSGSLRSEVAGAKVAKMVSRDFRPQATIRDVCKNAALVDGAATMAGLDATILAAAKHRFDAAFEGGREELDMAAVITAYGSEQEQIR
jgi:3-hydroxyisobutyrate dehydrogenase